MTPLARALSALALAASFASAQPLPLEGMAHIGFRVSDLDRARAYYTGKLGFQQAFESGQTVFLKVNDDQFIRLSPGFTSSADIRFTEVAFLTPDIEALRRALLARGLDAPPPAPTPEGALAFSLEDPEKHSVVFVQYLEGSRQAQARGKFLDTRRVSDHLQHIGVTVPAARVDAALKFYRDQLGFVEVWRYSPTPGDLRLIKLRAPGRRQDIVELMIHKDPPTRAQFGSMHHLNFEVPEITPPYRALLGRGAYFDERLKPVVNAENIWAINLFDPDGTRTEIQDLRKVPTLRLGMVGLVHGHAAGFLGRFRNRYDAAIAAFAEPDREVAAAYAARFHLDPASMYPTVEEMLDKVKPQAVVVFTNTFDHQRVVELCAARGIHVMMEKPLAVSLEQARAIEAAQRRSGIHVLVNYETTWYPSSGAAWFQAKEKSSLGEIRKIVAHDGHRGPKEIGVPPEFLSWLSDPKLNGAGALFDFGCYGAGLMTWLMDGRRPLSVTAVTQQFKPAVDPRVDDEATITLAYPGAQGIIQASWNWPFDRKDLEVYGRTGQLKTVGPGRVRLRLEGKDEEEIASPPLDPRYDDPVAYFTAVIRGEIKPSGPSSLAVNVVATEILDAARQSAATGRTIRLASH